MRKYHGLRIIGSLFILSSILISIFTLVSVGVLIADSIKNQTDLDLIQALFVLIAGLIIALFLYAFAQVADIQLKNYTASRRIIYELVKTNQLNNQILELLTIQLDVLQKDHELKKELNIADIQQQIEERRARLESDAKKYEV